MDTSERDVEQLIQDVAANCSKDVRDEARGKALQKNTKSRFDNYCNISNELIVSGPSLLPGTSAEADAVTFEMLVTNVEKVWLDSCRLFRAESYPTSLFLAILCIEETGKVGVERFNLALNETKRQQGAAIVRASSGRKKNNFYSHTKKHILAAGAGALINARLDRILGLERVIVFLDEVENNKIEDLRQHCLYIDHDGVRAVLPYESINADTAQFYIVLAGELMAESLGVEPDRFEALITQVEEFERSVGLLE
jgi:AbiV family abortive infection protein